MTGRLIGWEVFENGVVYNTIGKSHVGKGRESEMLYKTKHNFTWCACFRLDVA